MVFSSQDFTEPARILAQFCAPQTILLWIGDEVSYALDQRKFIEGTFLKYRRAVEYGLSDSAINRRDEIS